VETTFLGISSLDIGAFREFLDDFLGAYPGRDLYHSVSEAGL